jgi:hypothetical protein
MSSSPVIIRGIDPIISNTARHLLKNELQTYQTRYLENKDSLQLCDSLKRVWPRNDHERIESINIDVSVWDKENSHPVPYGKNPHQVFKSVELPIMIEYDLSVSAKRIFERLKSAVKRIFIDMVMSVGFEDFYIHQIRISVDIHTYSATLHITYYGLRVDYMPPQVIHTKFS